MPEHYFRSLLQLTQEELSLLLKINKSAIAHAERGQRTFSKRTSGIISKFAFAVQEISQASEEIPMLTEMRVKEVEVAVSPLRKDIRNYKFRLEFNQRALRSKQEKFEGLMQSIAKLHCLKNHPEKFSEHELDWINQQIRFNEIKLKSYSLEKLHQLELRIAEVEAGLARAEEMMRQIEGKSQNGLDYTNGV